MKIIIVGATSTLAKAVVKHLGVEKSVMGNQTGQIYTVGF